MYLHIFNYNKKINDNNLSRMKKICLIMAVFLFVFVSVATVKQTQTQVASTIETSGYAQINTNDCYLIKDLQAGSKYFLLEQSYFVKVLQDFDETYLKVAYLDFEGYVEKSKVSFVEEYPDTPFLSGIMFDIYNLGNVCMRSSPKTIDDDSNILCTIPQGKKDLLYYGKISGEEAISGLGNIWYFCAYQDNIGNVCKGYVYAPLTTNLSTITQSSELVTIVDVATFTPVDSLLYLNLSTKNLLILVTAIPCIAVVLLMTVPPKKQKIDNTKSN